MSNLIFLSLLNLLHLLRLLLSAIFVLIPHSRKRFEQKNLQDASCQSFKYEKCSADYCFEVSSEGELEQVRPLVLYYLGQGKKIELIFSSPSVEEKCIILQKKFSSQLRIFRLPLVTLQFLKNWVTAPVMIFCRYDFFPELLLLKFRKKKFVLVSGAVKKNYWYKNHVFSMFDVIVAATTREEERFRHINPKAQTFAFDFRIERITERWKAAISTLQAIPELQNYLQYLNGIPQNERIILGSAWGSDLAIFDNPEFIEHIKKSKVHVLIVPHQLGGESIKTIQNFLARLGIGDYVSLLEKNRPITPVVILNMSGILCEFYSLFCHAYVGGGYERSIHSVFEPFFSGGHVYTGPKIHRSTEYDFLAEIAPEEIHVLFNPEQFYNIYMENRDKTMNQELRNFWRQSSSSKIAQIAKAIDVK